MPPLSSVTTQVYYGLTRSAREGIALRFTAILLALIALASFAQGFWVLAHGGTVLQFVLLEGVALLLASGAGWFWGLGRK